MIRYFLKVTRSWVYVHLGVFTEDGVGPKQHSALAGYLCLGWRLGVGSF